MDYNNKMEYTMDDIYPREKMHLLGAIDLYDEDRCGFKELCTSRYEIYALGDVYVTNDILKHKDSTLDDMMDDVIMNNIDIEVDSIYSVEDWEYLYGKMEGAVNLVDYVWNDLSLSYLEGLLTKTEYILDGNKLVSIKLGDDNYVYIENEFEDYERFLAVLQLYTFWVLRSVVSGVIMLRQVSEYSEGNGYVGNIYNIVFFSRDERFKVYQLGYRMLHPGDLWLYKYLDGQTRYMPEDALCNRF